MLEFKTLILSLNDPALPDTLKQMESDGWIPVPGVPPQVMYVICRQVGQQQMMRGEGFGKLAIDETKMYFIDKDGNRVERH
jgi:hypothetical protein